LAAHVRHDSMLLLLERADFPAAEDEAERAVELYPLHDKRFPFFVVDFALVRVMQQRYGAAIPLLQLCLDVIEEPAVRGMIASMLARAYAGLGSTIEYERFREWATALAEKHAELAPATFYHLAEAARAGGEWDVAEMYAVQSRELAFARGDREIIRHAERALGHVHSRTITPPLSLDGPERLVSVLRIRLKRWNPQNHRGRADRVPFRNQWVA
jgi:tetratricopeptide (TPR) repeat protein